MRVVPKPESHEAAAITESTTSDDLQAFYQEVKPGGTATITVTKLGPNIIAVTTTASPDWAGQFAPGDLVIFADPIFVHLGRAADYVPYDSIYVTPEP